MENSNEKILKTGEWLTTIILTLIPLVNIFFLFYWIFDGHTNQNKVNYAKATLILYAILFGILAIIAISLYQLRGIFE